MTQIAGLRSGLATVVMRKRANSRQAIGRAVRGDAEQLRHSVL